MSVTQTVDIPANRRLIIEVPQNVPVGRTILTFTPIQEPETAVAGVGEIETASTDEALTSARGILTKHLSAFKELAK